jgi:hypothetical protein
MGAEIVERYAEKHLGKALFLGDATGNSRKTSATMTDWQIIAEAASKFRDPYVQRGLIQNTNITSGKTTYSNPLNRDAINNANRLLMDGTGRVRIYFLPESRYPSGGTAKSVGSLAFKTDGGFDVRNERKLERDIVRSHHADTFKYVCWYFDNNQGFWRHDKTTKPTTPTREERRNPFPKPWEVQDDTSMGFAF